MSSIHVLTMMAVITFIVGVLDYLVYEYRVLAFRLNRFGGYK